MNTESEKIRAFVNKYDIGKKKMAESIGEDQSYFNKFIKNGRNLNPESIKKALVYIGKIEKDALKLR